MAEENPSSENKPKRKVNGVLITKETAKAYALSAAQAKKRRKDARMSMLNALTTKLDLGEEIVKAWATHDDAQMALIEKALKIVGLTHDQSDEARAQNFNIKSDVTAKISSPNLNITFKDAEKS